MLRFRDLLVAVALQILCLPSANAQEPESRLPDSERIKWADDLKRDITTASQQETAGLNVRFASILKSAQLSTSVTPPISLPSDEVLPFIGGDVDKVIVIENGAQVEKNWSELDPVTWRKMLQDQYTATSIYAVDQSGNFAVAPGTASLGKKTYRLVYNNFITKDYPCSEADVGAGRLLVGVGLRITVQVKSKAAQIGVSLPALALGANAKKLEGKVEARIIGLAGSQSLSQVVGAGVKDASYDSLVQASNAYAMVNAVLENKNMTPIPKVVGYIDSRAPGSCLAAINKLKSPG